MVFPQVPMTAFGLSSACRQFPNLTRAAPRRSLQSSESARGLFVLLLLAHERRRIVHFAVTDSPTAARRSMLPRNSRRKRPRAISAEIAAHNAWALRHSPAEEVKILVLHGVLHLRGYDHECDNGQMARREKQLRAKLHLPLGLIERALTSAAQRKPSGSHTGRKH